MTRITNIDVHWLRIDLPRTVADAMTNLTHWDVIATKLSTDAGLVGWGYNCTIAEGSEALVTLLEKDLAPRFIGTDPFLIRRLWKSEYLDRFATSLNGFGVQGVAAIEIAAWDIIAKACGQPLWRILGGYNAERIPAYSTDGGWLGFTIDQLVGNARRIQAEGFRGFKMKIGKPDLAEDHERVAAVRKAVGPGYPIMVDANGRWDTTTARRAIRKLAPLDIFWFEEPVNPLDGRAHRALASATDVPIMAGESICDIHYFRDLIVSGAIAIAQPDVLKLGGISGWMDVATLARVFGIPIVPAGFNMMQLDAHLMATVPNGLMMEHIPWLEPLFERPVRLEKGEVIVPQEPGAGTDFRPDALRQYHMH